MPTHPMSPEADAIVSRVVPGKLIYAELTGQAPEGWRLRDKTFGFKLDHVLVKELDGSTKPYRGESFPEIGIVIGKHVKITSQGGNAPDDFVLIIDKTNTSKPAKFFSFVTYLIKP